MKPTIFSRFGLGALVLTLAACGGGSGGDPAPAPSSLSGVAATGLAIAHIRVSARCAAGTVPDGTTDAQGRYTLTLPVGVTLPCLLQVASSPPLHALATDPGTAHITPVSDLIVARAAGTDDPAALMGGTAPDWTALGGRAATAMAEVRTQLASLGVNVPENPVTAPLVAATSGGDAGNAFDQALDALQARLGANGATQAQLRQELLKPTPSLSELLPQTPGTNPPPVPLSVGSMAPTAAAVGATVTLTGTGFDPDPFHMQVLFQPSVAAEIVSSSTTQIVVKVPDGAESGPVRVRQVLTQAEAGAGTFERVTPPPPGDGLSVGAAQPASGNGLLPASGVVVTQPSDTTTRLVVSRDNTHFLRIDFNSATGAVLGARFVWVAENLLATCGPSVNLPCDGIVVSPQTGTLTLTQQRMVGQVGGVPNPEVTATLNGELAFQMPAANWTVRASPSGFMLNALTFGGGRFVAVGMGKAIMVSDNGLSWQTGTSPSANYFSGNAVAHDGAQFVMVGDRVGTEGAPVIATSADGLAWTVRAWTHGSESSLSDVAAGGGRLTAVGLSGTLITSTDGGASWSAESGGGGDRWRGVASGGGVRVAVGSDANQSQGRILVNPGSGWVAATTAIESFCPRRVIWNGSLFLAVGGTGCGLGQAVVMRSTDGFNWTRTALPDTVAPSNHPLAAVTWDGGRFYAAGDNLQTGRVIVSSVDGVTWVQEHVSTASGMGAGSLSGIAGSGSRLVAVGGANSVTKP